MLSPREGASSRFKNRASRGVLSWGKQTERFSAGGGGGGGEVEQGLELDVDRALARERPPLRGPTFANQPAREPARAFRPHAPLSSADDVPEGQRLVLSPRDDSLRVKVKGGGVMAPHTTKPRERPPRPSRSLSANRAPKPSMTEADPFDISLDSSGAGSAGARGGGGGGGQPPPPAPPAPGAVATQASTDGGQGPSGGGSTGQATTSTAPDRGRKGQVGPSLQNLVMGTAAMDMQRDQQPAVSGREAHQQQAAVGGNVASAAFRVSAAGADAGAGRGDDGDTGAIMQQLWDLQI